ncbi:activating signal cointegrator 1 complex subunit 2 homolog [Penaeus monodon]|uniref:activating signal cointegrator 1 complex subunit 2 homolog n=1 Tax=Penaeus monodon TaxID=6687 RepID=UPI0018A7E0D4|nr:activating signal cointegrator 1 complex subunit 2 homolog [Penaeus monodon]
MRDAVEEAASSSTSTGSTSTGSSTQHRVPRLILIIICLTGAALLILNIVVVTCFLRRYIFKKSNMKVSERPSTSFDIATTATTPGSATCVDLVTSEAGSSVAPSDYQIEREECVEICVARDETPVNPSSECAPMLQPPLLPRAQSEHVPSPLPRRVQPASSPHHVQCLLSPHHRCTDSPPYLLSREDPHKSETPHLHASPKHGREDLTLPRHHLPSPRFTQSLALREGEVTVYDDISESENYEASSQIPDELPVMSDSSASAKHSQHRLNIPDVCPVIANTYEPILQHVRLQETILEYPEDHISVSSETSQNSRCSGCRDGSCSPYPAAVTPSQKPNTVQKPNQKRPLSEPACPSTSAKPITQVIYHGQPHLQQQLEQEREQDQSRQPKLYDYQSHLQPRLQQQHADGRYLPHQQRRRQESEGHHYPHQPQKHVEEEYQYPHQPQYNDEGYMFHHRHQPQHGDKDYHWYPERHPQPEEKCPCFYNGHERCVEEKHAPIRPPLQSSYCQSKYNMRGSAAESISY